MADVTHIKVPAGSSRGLLAAARCPVVVTSGGTSEPIDDVRSVTNFASGRFTNEVARAMLDLGHPVTLIASATAALHARLAAANGNTVASKVTSFTTTADLRRELGEARTSLSAKPAHGRGASRVVFCGAAIADYVCDASAGKLPSDAETLTVTLHRNGKVIDSMRDEWGAATFLVGFKLGSGWTSRQLCDAARELCGRARLNLVVANDLSECRDGQHPVWLVTPEGGALRVVGTRAEVAAKIAAFVERRADVEWSATVSDADIVEVSQDVRATGGDVLAWSQTAGLLPGHDGNVAARVPASAQGTVSLWVTPRGVSKHSLTATDFVFAVYDPAARTTRVVPGCAKPSIDTSVQARVLAAAGRADFVVHSHELLGRTHGVTRFAFPCGAVQEADEVIEAAGKAISGDGFAVDMVFHGMLVAFNGAKFAQLRSDWELQSTEYLRHLGDVIGADTFEAAGLDRVTPVVDVIDGELRIVGAAGWEERGVSIHVGEHYRGGGIGQIIAAQLRWRGAAVVTVDDCGVVDWWESQGFAAQRNDDGTIVCSPSPVEAATLIEFDAPRFSAARRAAASWLLREADGERRLLGASRPAGPASR